MTSAAPRTSGYPKLGYKGPRPAATCGHVYTVTVQASPRAKPETIGTVRRYGSLPSCQSWSGVGNWPGAQRTRSRSSRRDAGADLWAAWRDS